MPQVVDQKLLDALIAKFGAEKGAEAYAAIMKARCKK